MNEERALKVWECMYQHILNTSFKGGKEWLFLHYDQVLEAGGCERLAQHTDADIDIAFPEKKYKRSMAAEAPPLSAKSIYLKLCEKAEFNAAL